MPDLAAYREIAGVLLVFLTVVIAALYWPRAFYHHANPFLSGEDYWVPFSSASGPFYARGPRPWRWLGKLYLPTNAYLRSDAGREETISRALRAAVPWWRDVAVRVRRGEIRLFGCVPGEEEKRAAERIAKGTGGMAVVSHLRAFRSPLQEAA